MRAATLRSLLWVVLSLGFSLVVAQTQGPDRALDFLTGYLIEYSLSVDNIFVFVLIFAYFKVPPISQHRVLVWGIVGALVMRGRDDLAGCFPRLQVPLHPLRFRRFSVHYRDPDGLQQTANGFWRQLVPADVPQINAGNATTFAAPISRRELMDGSCSRRSLWFCS